MAATFISAEAPPMPPRVVATGFRPEVEGLRAVAVGAVILYHFGGPDVGNAGFVGVDIFFVISGYLITRLIVAELQSGAFSFTGFYARRVRRIIPALATVILCTMAMGTILLTPSDLAALGREAAAAAIGVGNIHFWLTSGYFEQAAAARPLLHTWSLGVEEQFYLVWPAIAWAIFRFFRGSRPAFLGALFVLIGSSFAASQSLLLVMPEFTFYMLPTRAWQMAVGAALVFAPGIMSRGLAEAAGLAGLALMLGAIMLIDPQAPYPGWQSLLPTLGAALAMWPNVEDTSGKHGSLVARLLSLRAMTATGRLSYALYLWHWPVLVLFKVWNLGSPPDMAEGLILLAAVVVLSAATHRWIETPMRRRQFPNGVTLIAGGGIIVLVSSLGVAVERAGGMPSRLSPEGLRIAAFKDRQAASNGVAGLCNVDEDLGLGGSTCLLGEDPRPKVLLFGDSHAEHLARSLADAFPGIVLHAATMSGCRPVLYATGRNDCVAFVTRVLQDHVPQAGYSAVVLSARWRNGQSDQAASTAEWLSQYTGRVLVLGQTMEYTTALPEVLLAGEMPRRKMAPDAHLSRLPALREVDAAMRAALSDRGIDYHSMLETVCPIGHCTTTTPDGVPVSWDYGHFNPQGADLMVKRLIAGGLSLP